MDSLEAHMGAVAAAVDNLVEAAALVQAALCCLNIDKGKS
jgi:hypothetical protein